MMQCFGLLLSQMDRRSDRGNDSTVVPQPDKIKSIWTLWPASFCQLCPEELSPPLFIASTQGSEDETSSMHSPRLCVQTGSAAKCWFCQQRFTSRTNTYPLKSKAVNLNSKGSHGTECFYCSHLTLWTCLESPQLLPSLPCKQHSPAGAWALLNSPLGIQRCICIQVHRLSTNEHMPVILQLDHSAWPIYKYLTGTKEGFTCLPPRHGFLCYYLPWATGEMD